jgi:hypothetical protein
MRSVLKHVDASNETAFGYADSGIVATIGMIIIITIVTTIVTMATAICSRELVFR